MRLGSVILASFLLAACGHGQEAQRPQVVREHLGVEPLRQVKARVLGGGHGGGTGRPGRGRLSVHGGAEGAGCSRPAREASGCAPAHVERASRPTAKRAVPTRPW